MCEVCCYMPKPLSNVRKMKLKKMERRRLIFITAAYSAVTFGLFLLTLKTVIQVGDSSSGGNSLSTSPVIFNQFPREEVHGTYDPKLAFASRLEILNYVCSHYSDYLAPESLSVGTDASAQPEERRRFLLNRDMTYCVPDFNGANVLSGILDNVVDEQAKSELDDMNPCAAKELKRKVDENMQESSESLYNVKPPSPSPRCDLAREIQKLTHKVMAVQHPMERIAAWVETEMGFIDSISEEDTRNEVRSLVQRVLTENTSLLNPYWRDCRVCQKAYRPTVLLKREFINRDTFQLFKVLNFTEYAKREPPDLESIEGVGEVSRAAGKIFPLLQRREALELFSLYRADHELFGYDPTPYLNLAASSKQGHMQNAS